MTHFIRQQFLHIDITGTETEGLAMQRLMPDFFYENLLPALEKVFDQSVPSDKLLKLDRLYIDAGSIAVDRIDQELTNAIVRELNTALIEKRNIAISVPDKSNDSNIFLKDNRENLFDVFIYFLKTGTLPWSFRLSPGKTLEDELRDLPEHFKSVNYRDKFREVLSQNDALNRLGNQFSMDLQKNLLKSVSGEIAGIIDKIRTSAQKESFSDKAWAIFVQSLYKAAFSYYSNAEKATEAGYKSFLLKVIPETISISPPVKRILSSGQINGDNVIINSDHGSSGRMDKDDLNYVEGIYIDNAGLVLLHPFLPRFFEGLGISKDTELLLPDRALQLLHYMVTGKKNGHEYDLVLPKILCGIPLQQPVSGEIKLNRKETGEAEAMLEAAIGHWEALRSTSPEGLRESFLKRPGKLILKDEDEWVLYVESLTHDILLDHLPWGISMIKLPWMHAILRVEWGV